MCMQISRRGWELTGEPEEYSPLGREEERPRTQVGAQRFSSLVFESFMRMSWVIKN